MFFGTAQVFHQVCQVFCQFCVSQGNDLYALMNSRVTSLLIILEG
jgi:hypothetical protein